ncbi:hypothetical protein RchiOBHm_Chr5g0060581 [Rosa chinensis]|uniref:Uncharacterized protein n=1 Tax=Rosa chinensis TaxID=74649 RepID=A0A2P6QHQ1_ROSCH|nr:hypothetical protein RchiOBHm_Chr5g0060581 [Rosa chinensis]
MVVVRWLWKFGGWRNRFGARSVLDLRTDLFVLFFFFSLLGPKKPEDRPGFFQFGPFRSLKLKNEI